MKTKILILIRYYIPAYKCGGPVRTLENVISHLGDRIDFYVICSDRDVGDKSGFPGIETGNWQEVGKTKVLYLRPKSFRLNRLKQILLSIRFDALYLNSIWDPVFTLLPLCLRKLRLVPGIPVLLAPRGELYQEALRHKKNKKAFVFAVGRMIRIWDSISWHFSSTQEAEGFYRRLPARTVIHVFTIKDLASGLLFQGAKADPVKEKGDVALCYVGRIHPHKNLHYLLERLNEIREGQVTLNIYGMIEDSAYWDICQMQIDRFAKSITAIYHGPVQHPDVLQVYLDHHLSIMPSKSENFGHSIRESIMSGCPVLIGQNTPWQHLEVEGTGYVCDLADSRCFVETVKKFIAMDQEAYHQLRKGVREGAMRILEDEKELVDQYAEMFETIRFAAKLPAK